MIPRSQRISAIVAGYFNRCPVDAGVDFDLKVTAARLVVTVGIYLDGWSHLFLPPAANVALTPWHGVLYAGMLINVAVIGGEMLRQRRLGRRWVDTPPAGYGLAVLAGAGFVVGTIGDLAWHALFGSEAELETLLSPSHLLLNASGVLTAVAPLRAAWYRGPLAPGWRAALPVVASGVYVLLLLCFITQFAHPFMHPVALETRQVTFAVGIGDMLQAFGVAAVVLQSALLAAVATLLLSRNWQLPFGWVTFLVVGHLVFVIALVGQWSLLPAAVVGGLLGDVVAVRLGGPSRLRLRTLALGGGLPGALYGAYFLSLLATGRLAWGPSLWIGAIVVAVAVGLLVATLYPGVAQGEFDVAPEYRQYPA